MERESLLYPAKIGEVIMINRAINLNCSFITFNIFILSTPKYARKKDHLLAKSLTVR